MAQESPTPTPAAAPVPEASPASSVAPEASPAAAAVTPPAGDAAPPVATPSPAASSDLPPPPAEASPSPADASPSASPTPTPSPSPDTIPLEGQQPPPEAAPSSSPDAAPLDTQNLAPTLPEQSATDKAMPDAAFTDPNAIIPDQPPAPPGLPQSTANSQEAARKLNVRYHEVRVEADKDPQVLHMYERSTKATTDEDRRAALREYYRLLFKKIVSLDKSLDDKCQRLEAAYERRLAQQRMEPTIPLNPPPTPEPLHN